MVKPGKSSASSNTRKKHAKKLAQDEENPPAAQPQKKQRGQKLSKAQRKALPKVKQYVPPPKPPAPPIPDPLDGQGLARTLPADLVVVLRRLGKKDDVTRRKGLEELKEGWVGVVLGRKEGEEEQVESEIKENALLAALPVWMHNLASLLQSPFHRTTALQLHNDILSIPSLQSAVLETLSLSLLPGSQNRDITGSWLVAALEEGKRSGGSGLKVWEASTSFRPADSKPSSNEETLDLLPHLSSLIEYLSLSILDPQTLHSDIHPAPVSLATNNNSPIPSARVQAKATKIRPSSVAPSTGTSTPAFDGEEVEEERWARYRVAGFVGLSWLLSKLSQVGHGSLSPDLQALLLKSILWSALSSESPDSLGYQQPPIRRAAYNLLGVLLDVYNDEVQKQEMQELLAVAVLDSCWTEKEATVWETAGPAVVRFLSKSKGCWQLAMDIDSRAPVPEEDDKAEADEADDDDAEDDHESDSEDDEEKSEAHDEVADIADNRPAIRSSKAFARLLEFISTICPSIPHLTYPILLVVISTLPPSLLPLENTPSLPLQNLYSHLWSALDARLLSTHSLPGSVSVFQVFLQSTIDCTTLLVGRSWSAEDAKGTAEWLVRDQLGRRIWGDGVLAMGRKSLRKAQQVKGAPELEAAMFGQALARVGGISEDLVREVNPIIKATLLDACFPAEATDASKISSIVPRSLTILEALQAVNGSQVAVKGIEDIVAELGGRSVDRLAVDVKTRSADASLYAEAAVDLLTRYTSLASEEMKIKLVDLIQHHALALAETLPPSLAMRLLEAVTLVVSAEEQANCKESFWNLIESSNAPQETRFALVQALLTNESARLLTEGSLDKTAVEATELALTSESLPAISVASACISQKTHISLDSLHTVVALVSTAIQNSIHDTLSIGGVSTVPTAALEIFATFAKDNMSDIVASEIYTHALVAVHHLVFLLPRLEDHELSTSSVGSSLWSLTQTLGGHEKTILNAAVGASLAEIMGQVASRVDPGTLIDVALQSTIEPSTLLPSLPDLLSFLSRHTSRNPDQSLPLLDPIVPYVPDPDPVITRPSDFDSSGRSQAARYAVAALTLLRSDRKLMESKPDLLRVALMAMVLAQDALSVPAGSRGLYSPSMPLEHLAAVVRDAEGVLSYSLSASDELPVGWHATTVQALKSGSEGGDFLQSLLTSLQADTKKGDSDVSARIFRDVLGKHLRQSGAGEAEGEVWLNYAMVSSERNPQLSLAIILAVKPLLLDTKSFSLAQNRLANALTTLPIAQANSKGIPALRLLIASAPPPDAASVFLPQQRAVFVLRHVGGWLLHEDADDLAEEIEYRIAELYTSLAPVVQDLSGGHWDSIFDLIESGLESSDLEDPSTYCLLYQCLVLLQQVRDLCQSNKTLKASWTAKDTHMKLVLKLFLHCRNANSTPLQLIQSLILDLLQDASEATMNEASLAENCQLCDLLKLSSAYAIQSTAYRVLSQVIKRQTVELVLEVEASVAEADEGHAARTIALPQEIMAILEIGRLVDWHFGVKVEMLSSQLLSWMAILDHFEDASTSLRWAYVDQLNTSKLLSEGLLPMLFAMLGVSEMGAWNFPASQYAVDEFYPDLLDPEEVADLVPLASHLFYRALVTIPSAMRTYYEGCKDRQLSLSILTFTARYYSPIIIQHELAALREPRALAQLTEEGLNVRIAQGGGATVVGGSGGAEAIASYVVDEQPMEIGIRLPAEFPLRGVDVRDLKRVGVPENKWRGWLMSVQQTITSRNGLIMEALTVFKKNVALHFEGVVECAICYSIISLTDRTLPTKPCRTCKNRFHASCLFKWFNSSHSSSCPMCRSLF
ncbi:E3 ubiquitin-protein ligase listerin, partial [Tremellales sp. Uapishka_1]